MKRTETRVARPFFMSSGNGKKASWSSYHAIICTNLQSIICAFDLDCQICRDSFGEPQGTVLGDTLWAGSYGVKVDVIARSHCPIKLIATEDLQVTSESQSFFSCIVLHTLIFISTLCVDPENLHWHNLPHKEALKPYKI
jgi:hypothetical protein